MKGYESMSAQELSAELDRLRNLLADTEDDRSFVLGQSGNHVSGGFVRRFEEELNNIRANIDIVKSLMGQ